MLQLFVGVVGEPMFVGVGMRVDGEEVGDEDTVAFMEMGYGFGVGLVQML